MGNNEKKLKLFCSFYVNFHFHRNNEKKLKHVEPDIGIGSYEGNNEKKLKQQNCRFFV